MSPGTPITEADSLMTYAKYKRVMVARSVNAHDYNCVNDSANLQSETGANRKKSVILGEGEDSADFNIFFKKGTSQKYR